MKIKYKLQTLLSVIKVNFLIILNYLFDNKKIIIFFNPNPKLTNITKIYINDFLNSLTKDFKVFFLCQPGDNKDKSIKITQKGCKFLYGVDIFLNTYVCDFFPFNSKKIYIHHDIYDTPLTNNKNYNELIKKLIAYDYIFTSSKITSTMFKKIFDHRKKQPKIIDTGYLKLDYLNKKKLKIKNNNKTIIIAPTDFRAFKEYSLFNLLPDLIYILIYKLKLNVIFRPHPSNRNTKEVTNIEKKYMKNKKFKLDLSSSYLKNYKKSFCMITDISGTSYTFSFLTNSPIIFFSKKKISAKLKSTNFFLDRKKIGLIFKDLNEIEEKVKYILKNKKNFALAIQKLKMSLSNIGSVKTNMAKEINRIIKKD